MTHPNTLLFDLDGTLTDPGDGITNSVMHALRRFGIEPPAREALYCFIGPPLVDSFQRFYGLTPEDARLGVTYYREYFTEKGIFENTVYPGIPELLSALREAGDRVVLATSKPQPFAEQILAHFGLAQYFDCVAGALLDETRTKKAEVIEYALQLIGTRDAVMIGDREHDVLGAAACGLPCIGVLYGYGDEKELTAAGAAALARDVAELRHILLDQ